MVYEWEQRSTQPYKIGMMAVACLDSREAVEEVVHRWKLSDSELCCCHVIAKYENKLHLFDTLNTDYVDVSIPEIYLMCDQYEKFRNYPKRSPWLYVTPYATKNCIEFMLMEVSMTAYSFDYEEVYAAILTSAVGSKHYEYIRIIKTVKPDMAILYCPKTTFALQEFLAASDNPQHVCLAWLEFTTEGMEICEKYLTKNDIMRYKYRSLKHVQYFAKHYSDESLELVDAINSNNEDVAEFVYQHNHCQKINKSYIHDHIINCENYWQQYVF
jgi:hypothetical protein